MFGRNSFSFPPSPLSQNPVEMGGAGHLQVQGNVIPLVIEPVQYFLVVMGGNGLALQPLAPARWNQQEEMMGDCP